MADVGIVVRAEDKVAAGFARKIGVELRVDPKTWELPWRRTLFLSPGVRPPWDLLAAGFGFLERWDAAAPLWRYGVLAGTMGAAAERERTQKICLDLRLLPYEPGLLFVRDSEDGRRLLAAWVAECKGATDHRLAFLRALHLVKPLFCALPRSWLAEEEARARQTAQLRRVQKPTVRRLVQVEIAPGRFVKCHEGDEEKVKAHYRELLRGRK